MIVEPAPATPRSPLRRAAGLLATVLPVVLLAAVVAGGVLGQGADAEPARSPAPSRDPMPAATAPRPAAQATPAADGLAFPAVLADLRVRSVADALRRRPALEPDRLLAIGGYLSAVSGPAGCPGASPGAPAGLGPLCDRLGILVDRPSGAAGVFFPTDAHLHARFAVGVQLPPAVVSARSDVDSGGVPVVVIGRFTDAAEPCGRGTTDCGVDFLVDRVAWLDGREVIPAPVLDAGLDTAPREWVLQHQVSAEVAAVGWSGTVLVSALLRPETLARVDPTAAQALAATPVAGLVWYVRGTETDYDPTRYPLGQSPPRLRWILLDDVTGRLLATGGATGPTG